MLLIFRKFISLRLHLPQWTSSKIGYFSEGKVHIFECIATLLTLKLKFNYFQTFANLIILALLIFPLFILTIIFSSNNNVEKIPMVNWCLGQPVDPNNLFTKMKCGKDDYVCYICTTCFYLLCSNILDGCLLYRCLNETKTQTEKAKDLISPRSYQKRKR